MGAEQPQQPSGSQAGSFPTLQTLQGTGLCNRGRDLILLVEKLHFVAQTSKKLIHSTLLSVWEFL